MQASATRAGSSAMPLWKKAIRRFFVSAGSDGNLYLWDAASGRRVKTLRGHTGWIDSVAINPRGDLIASACVADMSVRLWEVESGRCVEILQAQPGLMEAMAFSPDGRLLAVGGEFETIWVWDVEARLWFVSLRHTNSVRCVAFNRDGDRLASCDDDGIVRVWDARSWNCLLTIQADAEPIWSVYFSPDGCHIVTGSDSATIKFWDATTGECIRTLRDEADRTWMVSFHPRGHRLLSGGGNSTVRVWNLASGQIIHRLEGHTAEIRWAIFSHDGRFILTTSNDETMRLWDAETFECLHTLRAERPYERMIITDVTGLTEAQRISLAALGAIDEKRLERSD